MTQGQSSTMLTRLSGVALRAWLLLLRQDVKFTNLNIKRLERRNLRSTRSVVVPRGPVVSLTTYGKRLDRVHLVIESIAAGKTRPSRLILWLDDMEALNTLPAALQRLQKRGLEILPTENYGPHKKYFPYVMTAEKLEVPLVTADDDCLYSGSWLSGLVKAHADDASVINCYRAHVAEFVDGAFTPYLAWKACTSTKPSQHNFATGVSGCVYPAEFLIKLRLAGSGFLGCCPRADDVWLHVNALRNGFPVKQIWERALNYPTIPGSQGSSLASANVLLGHNDEQIRRTYLPADIDRLLLEETNPG